MELCKQTIIDSFRNISFYGERRGEQDFNYYSELLEQDLKELGENTGNYRQKFIDKVMTIYHRQGGCASSFITGPANFNVSRAQKKWDSRDKACNDFEFWRKKYFKAVNRVRTLSPEQEIDKTIKELSVMENKKELMKEFNKLMKKSLVNDSILILETIWPDIQENAIKEIIGEGRFQSYQITSLTTKIRERKKKIQVMKNRIEAKENQKPVNFKGGSIYIENDRVIISHDEKPSRDIIQAIKSHGFRWSPKCKNWCRKHTGNARYNANLLLKNVLGGQI